MNKRTSFSATYTPGASGVWWRLFRNGADTGIQGSAPTRRLAERDVSDAIAVLEGRAVSNFSNTRSAS